MKPTIVLVHGAFAESASWHGVIRLLHDAGHRVIAAANPLRSLTTDAAAVADLLAGIKGPVVLAGHSYGGAVITNAARDNADVKALVYVAALAPDKGETTPELLGKYPGATLGEHLYEVALSDGELYTIITSKEAKGRRLLLLPLLVRLRRRAIRKTRARQVLSSPREA